MGCVKDVSLHVCFKVVCVFSYDIHNEIFVYSENIMSIQNEKEPCFLILVLQNILINRISLI